MRKLFVLFSILYCFIVFGGFSPDIFVKIPSGELAIQELALGEMVCSQGKQAEIVSKSRMIKLALCITLDDQKIIACHDQLFFLPNEQNWKPASELKPNDLLLDDQGQQISINDIQLLEELTEIIDLSLSEPHTFYVTNKHILVHNYVPIAIVAVEAVPAIIEAAKVGVIGLAAFFAKHKFAGGSKNLSGSAFPLPQPPIDPEKDDCKVKIFEKNAKHIFTKKRNHLPDTVENRKLLIQAASDTKNFKGIDRFGNQWFAMFLSDGKQVWVCVRNNMIRDGGLNEIPRMFNPVTGLCRNVQ